MEEKKEPEIKERSILNSDKEAHQDVSADTVSIDRQTDRPKSVRE